MNERLTELIGPSNSRVNILGWAVIATVIAYSGPFGTYQTQSFWIRLLFWSLAVASSLAIGRGCYILASRLVDKGRPALTDFAMLVLMVAVFPPVLWLLTHALFRPDSHPLPSLLTLVEYVAVMTVAVSVIRRMVPGFGENGRIFFGAVREPATKDAQPRLAKRLPKDFRGPILRLSGRDHFVDVVGHGMSHTIRFRFGDAVAEMEPIEGFFTHRSHWVARAAIDGAERKDGRSFLRLVNGDLVPVSRKYKPDLEAAGAL